MSSINLFTLTRWLYPNFQRSFSISLILLLSVIYSHSVFADAEETAELPSVFSNQLTVDTTAVTGELVEISDPSHSTAIVVSTDSQTVASPATKFKAGISVDSATPTLIAQAQLNQSFVFNSTIIVDSAHVGQTADLIMVVAAEMQPPFEGDEDTVYAMINHQDEFVHVDLYQPQAD